MAITRGAKIQFPPLFVEQMTQIILRNILDGVADPMQIRSAELLFRDQVVTLDDGRIMVADQEIVKLQIGIQRMQGEDATGNETAIDIMDRVWLPGVDQSDAALARRPLSVLALPNEKGAIDHYETRL